MIETKIIKAVFGASKSIVAPKRFKNDWGQEIEFVGIDLPNVFEAHFSNSKTGQAKKQIGQDNVVTVPDEYFVSGADIFCWVMVHDEATDGRTMYTVRIPVMERPEPINAEPTPVQQDVIAQAITALNSAVTTTTQKAQEASESADRTEHAAEGVEGYAERAEAAQSAAESARDRATQAETSARTSAATASEKASEAISSATTASQSAITAENASESASASADASYRNAETAYRYAQDSATSAGQAGDYANSAGGYSQTASQKASEAAQSASIASQSNTDAETAKTASQTAQGLAESARDSAISAKEDAEDARDEAQSLVDGISGKVEQVDSNTERIESLEDDRYKPYAVDTASGAIVSFPDGADNIPMADVLVNIDPVQDLHGYDHPWPAGGGKNLLPCILESGSQNGFTWTVGSDGVIVISGFSSSGVVEKVIGSLTLESGTYRMNGGTYPTNDIRMQLKLASGGSSITMSYNNNDVAFTVKETTSYTASMVIAPTTVSGTTTIKPMIRLSSVTDATYAPYSNICPISGWNGVNVSHSGADTSDATVYPITFPVEAGTVYGGTLDVTTGELVVDRANIASYNGETLPSTWISDRDAYSVGTTPTTGAQVVYELAEPITYQLTPTEIRSILGTNNVFADAGDSTVEYRADTKLYISKKIAEAVNALA